MPARKKRDATGAPPGSSPSDEARARILALLDSAKERHEKAFPGTNGDELLYFAHLSAIRQLTESFYQRLLKPHGVSHSEYRVLSTMRTRGRDFRTTPNALNQVVQITSAGMTRSLDRLEAAGHIERTPNPEDRRSVLVGLTSEGWDFARKLALDLAAHHADVLDGLAPKALRAETEVLRRVVERLADAVMR